MSAFKSKKERGGINKFKFTNVFVKNLPADYTQDKLEALFGKHGTINSSKVSQWTGQGKEAETKAFGFVNFDNPESAAAAVEALNGAEIDGNSIYVNRAQKREEHDKEKEILKAERQKKYGNLGVNLYVKNLADNIDEDRLREEFGKFGNITSCQVMRKGPLGDKTAPSKGFGFVCFSTPEEASKAASEMYKKVLENKPLYVALAQRKDVRRQQLEAKHAAIAKLGVPVPQQMYPPQIQGNPMFYPAGIPQRNFVYPQQMIPRRWAPGQGPQMMRHPINYQLMPINGGGRPGQGAPGGAQQQRGGSRRRQQGAPAGGPGMPPQGQPQGRQGQNYKYADNVRNRDQRPVSMQQPDAPPSGAGEPINLQALAGASESQQKQMIGEHLFPLIHEEQPNQAAKITGMLLEMDNGELIHLLESREARNEKIKEALAVLAQATGS